MIIFGDLLKIYVWMKHLFSSVSVREFPAGERDFLLQKVQTGHAGHPTCYLVGTGVLSLR